MAARWPLFRKTVDLADSADFKRFIDAQDPVYEHVIAELRDGSKTTHWIWFVFPQLAALGRSGTAKHFGLRDLDEAKAYLSEPLLRERLLECTCAMLDWAGSRTPLEVLGPVDAMKFRSCMTLFEAADGGDIFSQAIDVLCDGQRDQATLDSIS